MNIACEAQSAMKGQIELGFKTMMTGSENTVLMEKVSIGQNISVIIAIHLPHTRQTN
jgi:predicted metal-dependent TIM-barrel fold hydrolase